MANQPDDLFGTAICALDGPVTWAVTERAENAAAG
jgi:hypothetical protein